MSLGITPAEADRWVRCWGLTGSPTLAPEWAIPTYYSWNDALERFERGEIDEDGLLDECGDDGYSKYPHIDRPQRVCPGVILGPMGKYPHYAVDPAIIARIPIYLRGPNCHYHYEDDDGVLELCIPGFPQTGQSKELLSRLSYIQHEWHFGTRHPDAGDLSVAKLVSSALSHPEEMIALSSRAMPIPGGSYDFNKRALACLKGKDFAAFLRDKGAINPSTVVWYKNVPAIDCLRWDGLFYGLSFSTADTALPVFKDANKYQPSLPVYSYPFMSSPMSSDEYLASGERTCLLPLDEDYRKDDDEDDDSGGDDNEPHGPDILSLEQLLRDRETA